MEEQFLESLKVWKSPCHKDLGGVRSYYLNNRPLIIHHQPYSEYLQAKFFKWFYRIQRRWSLTHTSNYDIDRKAAVQQSTSMFYIKKIILIKIPLHVWKVFDDTWCKVSQTNRRGYSNVSGRSKMAWKLRPYLDCQATGGYLWSLISPSSSWIDIPSVSYRLVLSNHWA